MLCFPYSTFYFQFTLLIFTSKTGYDLMRETEIANLNREFSETVYSNLWISLSSVFFSQTVDLGSVSRVLCEEWKFSTEYARRINHSKKDLITSSSCLLLKLPHCFALLITLQLMNFLCVKNIRFRSQRQVMITKESFHSGSKVISIEAFGRLQLSARQQHFQ